MNWASFFVALDICAWLLLVVGFSVCAARWIEHIPTPRVWSRSLVGLAIAASIFTAIASGLSDAATRANHPEGNSPTTNGPSAHNPTDPGASQ